MKVLLVNALDSGGGAARAAMRLLHAVRDCGVDASLLVQLRSGDHPHVIGPSTWGERVLARVAPTLDAASVRLRAGQPRAFFSPAVAPDLVARKVAELAPDVVHLHWVGFGMLRVETLRRLGRPVVWTLHDAWALTGGCHVPFDVASGHPCVRYEDACGRCPVLGSDHDDDLSRRVWSRKRRAWRGVELTAVAPSRWLAARARASSLLRDARVEVIPNGLDLGRFATLEPSLARAALGLPPGKKLVVFGAQAATTDPNKGFPLLAAALRRLASHPLAPELHLVVFGSDAPSAPVSLPCPVTYLGWIRDDATLNRLYAAADVVVVPSRLENLPFAVMEAMASGAPTVAFRQGGVPDLVDHGENGYLARPYDVEDLAAGIAWVLGGSVPPAQLRAAARTKVERGFDVRDVAERHAALYRDVLAARPALASGRGGLA
ncbi:MAG TPA: glycosyltransferase [Anaeromyxobacter sp.]|nr:glycosyltransferase [Anaeromyxobacter sp.]